MRPCVVTIAGTDPSGGAGIQADIKAISATGSYAASVITALVAQNTQGVQAIQDIPPSFVQQQMDSVFGDLDCQAIKVGMLHNHQIINTVFNAVAALHIPHIVVDPVMVAKSGCPLLDVSTIDFLKTKLTGIATLITPNIPEAELLSDHTIANHSDMENIAQMLAISLQTNVLLKGGHLLAEEQSSDVLYSLAENKYYWFHETRIVTKNTHGTGCSLSSAIASYLAQGNALPDAVSKAKQYLTQAIAAGATQRIGKGCGPVDHFFNITSAVLPC